MADESEASILSLWSEKVEQLRSENQSEEAKNLLEKVIHVLRSRQNADVDRQLAKALQDLAEILYGQGLSLRADEVAIEASHIEQRAIGREEREERRRQAEARRTDPSHPNFLQDFNSSTSDLNSLSTLNLKDKTSKGGEEEEGEKEGQKEEREKEEKEEDDWETEWETNLVSIVKKKVSNSGVEVDLGGGKRENRQPEKVDVKKEESNLQVKQRGRGAFRFKSGAMYSDFAGEIPENISKNGCKNDGENSFEDTPLERGAAEEEGNNGEIFEGIPYGARHALEIFGFSPTLTTCDLEDVVKPYCKEGVSVRWIDDTHALAVFRNPSIAEKALLEINDYRVKIRSYTGGLDYSSPIKPRDLEPPVPRPSTSAKAARRMIANALKSHSSSPQMKKLQEKTVLAEKQAEIDRKNRLSVRRQMRDEAWGED